MKKLSCLLAVLAGMAVLGAPISVSADYENIEFLLSDEINQKLTEAIDANVKSNSEPKKSVSLFTPSEKEKFSIADFTIETYDLDSAIEIYAFDTEILLSGKSLSEAQELCRIKSYISILKIAKIE